MVGNISYETVEGKDCDGPFASAVEMFAPFGVAVFPTRADNCKRPAISGPQKGGIRRARELAANPKFAVCNAGIWCGPQNRITVADIDTADPDVEREVIARLGDTPLRTRTASGKEHLYYRHAGEKRSIRPFDDLDLDILGSGVAVVPPSLTADGQYFFEAGGPELIASLPVIRNGALPSSVYPTQKTARPATNGNQTLEDMMATGIPKGIRNDTLFRIALREAKHCDDEETLLDVMFPHAKRCIPPYPENRLTTIVRSAWSIEVDPDKENWVGGPARAVLSALELEMLEGNSDAALLLMKFRAAHGWRGSGQFFIANAMRLSLLDGGKPWTLRRFTAARDALERLGFLVCLHRPGENGLPGAYRFNTPQPQAA